MNIIVHLTNRCNLNCPYCFEKKRIRRSKLTFDDKVMRQLFEKILIHMRLIKDKRLALHFTGGESLVVPPKQWRLYFKHLRDVIPKSYRLKLVIQTNLYHLSNEMIEFIRDNNILVGTTYDFTRQTRLNYKGADASPVILRNIRRLQKAGVPFGVLCVVSKYNIDYMDGIYDLMCKNHQDFQFLPLTRAAYSYQRKYIIDPNEYAKNLYPIIEKYFSSRERRITFENAESYASVLLNDRTMKRLCRQDTRCGMAFLAVKGNGDVFSCPSCAYDAFKFGNFLRDDFKTMFSPNNPVTKMFRKRFLQPEKYNRSCRNCGWSHICNQGCPYESIQDGDFFKKSTFQCEANKYIFPRLKALLGNMKR